MTRRVSHVALKCFGASSARSLFISLSFDVMVPVSGRTPPFLVSSVLHADTHPTPRRGLRPRPKRAPGAAEQPARGETEGGRRSVTAQKLGHIVTGSCGTCHGALVLCCLAEHEARGGREQVEERGGEIRRSSGRREPRTEEKANKFRVAGGRNHISACTK